MAKTILKRLGLLIVTLLLVTVLAFVAFSILPGDPTTAILGVDATDEQIAVLRERLGLDLPLWQRYFDWLGGLVTGDLGESYNYAMPVAELLAGRVGVTAALAAMSFALILDLICCNIVLKPLVGRIRPFLVNTAVELLTAPPADASFPSGHTAASFAAVFALRASGSPLWKPALVLAAGIAFSRLYLYVHWPTDVLGGILVGAAAGWAGARLADALRRRRERLGRRA